MFDETIWVAKGRTRRPWTVPASFAGQVVVVGLMVLAPLIFTEKLTMMRMSMSPPLRVGVVRPEKPHVTLVPAGRESTPTRPTVLVMPTSVPRDTPKLIDPPRIETAANDGPGCTGALCIAGDPTGVPDGMEAPRNTQLLPPPRVERSAAVKPVPHNTEPIRIRVGGVIQEGKLSNRVAPVYPRLAVMTRTSGVVELAAVIGTDGRIRELTVVSGHPLLVPAAVDAVRHWVYQPTRLNGDPVEVSTSISVRFILGAQ